MPEWYATAQETQRGEVHWGLRSCTSEKEALGFAVGKRRCGYTVQVIGEASMANSSREKSMAKPKRGRRSATALDDHIGRRIRERRILLGLTQQELAEIIGVSYQQAHKYERGVNRVSAGGLFEIARALSAPITYFYEGIGQEGPRQITPHQRMVLEITRDFAEIRNEKHQEAVSHLARALSRS
jgi:transcriptional regulator with XRE-family HTH domain